MKLKPQIYAKSLLAAIDSQKPTKDIARNFLQLLEKNKQRKDLAIILAALEQEFAVANSQVLVEVESSRELSGEEITKLEEFVMKKLGKKPMFKTSIRPETVGVVLKYDGTILDASVNTKLDRLRQKLTQ